MRFTYVFAAVLLSLASFAFADEGPVARVNGVAISRAELEAAVDQLIPRATYHGNVSEDTRDGFREKAIEDLVNRELQYQDAVAKGTKPDKGKVKEQMRIIRDRFPSKKEYRKSLEQAGLSEDQLRALVEKDVLIYQQVQKTVTEPAQMSDNAVKEYYDQNRDKFRKPVNFRLRIISAQDKSKAMLALGKVQAGEDFGRVAAAASEDKYRIKGGDIGYVHKGRILPELEAAALQMKAGDISGLISADQKWFILKLEDLQPERQLSFDEVKGSIKKDLEAKRSEEIRTKWIAELRAKAKIEIYLVIK